MSELTLDQWLEATTAVPVAVPGKPEFTLQIDFAELAPTLYEATAEALEAAGDEAAMIAAYTRFLGRLVQGWSLGEGRPTPEQLARLGELALVRSWRAVQGALFPNAASSAGSASGSAPEAPSESAPGGTASSNT